MAKEQPEYSNIDPFKQPLRQARKVRANGVRPPRGVNAQAIGNAQFIEQKKQEIRYRNGVTLPTSAEMLFADARRKDLRHSGILSDNMIASGQTRPAEVAAHHIVSWQHGAAFASQELLFGWGVGINDVDNGVYLPRCKKTVVKSLPDAHKHSPLHTYVYHSEVYGRLVLVEPERAHSEAGRQVLRGIKQELIAGTFPYLEEHLA